MGEVISDGVLNSLLTTDPARGFVDEQNHELMRTVIKRVFDSGNAPGLQDGAEVALIRRIED